MMGRLGATKRRPRSLPERGRAGAAVVALAALLAGCGGSVSGQASTSGVPTAQPLTTPAATTVVAASTSTDNSAASASVALSDLRSSSASMTATTATTTASAVAPATAVATPTTRPVVAATPTPVSVPAITPGGVPIVGAAPATATALAPESDAVIAAFRRYLQVYADALLNLDPSHLHEVEAGKALQRDTQTVEQLKAKNQPVRDIEEDHRIGFARLTSTDAVLVDEYKSLSVYADPKTKQPLPRTGPPDQVRMAYEFQKVDGVWTLVDGVRQSATEKTS